MTDGDSIRHLTGLAGIRKRPAMYIGGTDFFGFVHYLVAAFDLMLENGASFLDLHIGRQFTIESDACISVSTNEEGDTLPYETFGTCISRRYHSPDACVIAALSESLSVRSSDGTTESSLEFSDGERTEFEQTTTSDNPSIKITFVPDSSIFSVTEISPYAVQSYCRRTSHLYPGVTIRLITESEMVEYHSDRGMRGYFDLMAAPYQILHKPIHIVESQDSLHVEAVFVYHSWNESKLWSFANRGRVPDGGTHETGFLKGIADLNAHTPKDCNAGVLGLLAIQYPDVAYEGCIKSRIRNPELIDLVAQLVSRGLRTWISENKKEVEFLSTIERFQFAGEW
jgi:DNA gyrase subunit B